MGIITHTKDLINHTKKLITPPITKRREAEENADLSRECLQKELLQTTANKIREIKSLKQAERLGDLLVKCLDIAVTRDEVKNITEKIKNI